MTFFYYRNISILIVTWKIVVHSRKLHIYLKMMKIKLFHILLIIMALSCYSIQKRVDDSVGVILIPKANCMVCKEQISNLLESGK